MNKNTTPKQFISLCVLFMITNVQVINLYPNSRINIWFAALISAIFSTPVLLMFARLSGLYPEDDLFGIIENSIGRPAGKIIGSVYIIYGIYIATIVLRYLTEFIQVVSMNETPQIILLIFFGFLSGYIIFKGPDILSELSTLIIPTVFALFTFIIICSFGFYDYSNFRPGPDENLRTFSDAALSIASFSFGELIFMINFLKKTKLNQNKKYGVMLISLLIGAFYVVTQIFSNQLILGTFTSSILYFPNYEAVSIINIGDFITHIEVISIISFLMCVTVKESICISVISDGAARLFKISNKKLTVIITTALIIIGGYLIFDSTMDIYNFHSLNKYIVLILQVIIPFVIYSVAEIRNIISKSRNTISTNKKTER